MFRPVAYESLNSRQKENHNFQKVAARLADYGYNCLRLTDDWQGADFMACHVDGETILKVQLKGRLTINKKYLKRWIYCLLFSRTLNLLNLRGQIPNNKPASCGFVFLCNLSVSICLNHFVYVH